MENKTGTSFDLVGFARGSLASVIGTAVAGGLQFLVTIVLTHSLRVGAAGTFFEALALVTILGTASGFGTEAGLVREIARLRALNERERILPIVTIALVPVLVLGLLLAGAVYGLASTIAGWAFHAPQRPLGVTYLRVLAPAIPLTAVLSALLAATRGFRIMRPTVIVQQLALPAARPVLVGFVVVMGFGATALGLAWTLPLVGGILVALALLRRLMDRDAVPRLRASPSASWWTEALVFWRFAGARGLASTIAIVTMLDVVLVGALDSARAAAIYAAATRFVILSAFFLLAIGRPLAPRFSELIAREDRASIEELYQLSTWWTLGAAWPVYLLLIVFAPFFMRVFGSSYSGGGLALAILSLGCLVDLGTGNLTMLLLMSGKSMWNLVNSLAAVAVNVALNVLLIPRMGIDGAAIAWTASIALDNLATLLQIFYLYRVRPFGRMYLSLALGCILCFGAVGYLSRVALGSGLAALAASAGVGYALYAGLLWRRRETLAIGALRQALGSSVRPVPVSDQL